MWCRYNAVNFLENVHKRHPLARPLGKVWGVYCGSSIWLIKKFCLSSCNFFIWYLTTYDFVTTALDCVLKPITDTPSFLYYSVLVTSAHKWIPLNYLPILFRVVSLAVKQPYIGVWQPGGYHWDDYSGFLSSERRALLAFIYRYWIFKWVAETWPPDREPSEWVIELNSLSRTGSQDSSPSIGLHTACPIVLVVICCDPVGNLFITMMS